MRKHTVSGRPNLSQLRATLGGLAVVRGDDAQVHSDEESSQGTDTWGFWSIEPETDVQTDPTAFVFTNNNGPGWAYVFRDSNDNAKAITKQAPPSPSNSPTPEPTRCLPAVTPAGRHHPWAVLRGFVDQRYRVTGGSR